MEEPEMMKLMMWEFTRRIDYRVIGEPFAERIMARGAKWYVQQEYEALMNGKVICTFTCDKDLDDKTKRILAIRAVFVKILDRI